MGIENQWFVLRDGYKWLRFCCSCDCCGVRLLQVCCYWVMGGTFGKVWIGSTLAIAITITNIHQLFVMMK